MLIRLSSHWQTSR